MKNDPFRATAMQFAVSGMVVAAAAIVAFLLPARPAGTESAPAPKPWLPGMIALVAGSMFLITPPTWAWGAVAVYIALDVIVIAVVTAFRGAQVGAEVIAWPSPPAQLSPTAWHAFLQKPVDGTTGPTVLVSNAMCLLIVLAVIFFAAHRQPRSEA